MNTNKIMFCICLFVLGLVTLFSIWLGYTIVIQASTRGSLSGKNGNNINYPGRYNHVPFKRVKEIQILLS